MTLKNTLFAGLLLLVTTCLSAQNVQFGLQAEVFQSRFSVDAARYSFDAEPGFAARLLVRRRIFETFSAQFELGYMNRKVRGEYSYTTSNALDPNVLHLYSADQNIVDMAATFRFQVPKGKVQPYFAPGLGVGFLDNTDLTYTNDDGAWTRTRTYSKADINILVDAGVIIPLGEWAIEPALRYVLSLNNLEGGPGGQHQRFGLVLALTKSF